MTEAISRDTIRSQKWDILKFFLIFLVVLGHAADFYKWTSDFMLFLRLFIYLFHMPLFMFISGLFSKKTVKEKRYCKLTGYIAVYAALKLFEFLYKLLSGVNAKFDFLNAGGSQWFVLTLLWLHLITVAVKRFPKKYVLTLGIAVSCACGFLSVNADFLAFMRTIVFFPFFYAGYCIDRVELENFCERKNRKIFAAVFLAVLAVLFFIFRDFLISFSPLFSGRYPFSRIGFHSEFGILYRLIYYFLSAAAGLCIIILAPTKTKSGIPALLGQRTLGVYGFHYIVFYFMYVRFDCRAFFNDLLGGFAVIIPVFASVAATAFFSLEIFNKLLNETMKLPTRLKALIKQQ